MTTANAVTDDVKMDNEQLGAFTRRTDEVKKRINQNVIGYDWAMEQLQRVVEGLDVLLLAAISMMLNCANQFSPAKFIGEGWSFWRGPSDGNGLEGEIEQDDRSASLSEFDPTKVQLITTLISGESSITGKENLARLRHAGHVRLGAQHFLAFWKDKSTIPESWKEKVNGSTRFIYFDGTVLRDLGGDRYVLCLCWNDGKWHWLVLWLGNDRDVHDFSAVLAS